jgi:hypothetical protein
MGDRRDCLVVMVIAQHDEPLALRGGGDEQVDWPGRAMRSGFGQQLLNVPGAYVLLPGDKTA